MKKFWVDNCIALSSTKADFYSGCRKILTNVSLTCDDLKEDIGIRDCGFTKSKLSMLTRNYLVPESIEMAKRLWSRRVDQGKYGSVGFTCYGHYVKGDIDQKRSKRASVQGPCIQSVTLTLLPKGKTTIDVFYRTTEFFKKFPADLVFLRDELLSNFDFDLARVNFHFANITCHPMYAVTFMPFIDPIAYMKDVKKHDAFLHNWLIKWTSRYICPEHSRGIQKFSQALRVQSDALERIDKKTLSALRDYCRKNHPGFRGDKDGEDEDE